uniref:Uncharacterized protein n=1 Tax=Opuntia streptacantha TaxID=393608 RepID=A0A7C9CK90_OPUST
MSARVEAAQIYEKHMSCKCPWVLNHQQALKTRSATCFELHSCSYSTLGTLLRDLGGIWGTTTLIAKPTALRDCGTGVKIRGRCTCKLSASCGTGSQKKLFQITYQNLLI